MVFSLFPIYFQLTRQSISIEREQNATHILYEMVLNQENQIPHNEIIYRNEEAFNVIWNENPPNNHQEVCVHYQNGFHKSVQKCKIIE